MTATCLGSDARDTLRHVLGHQPRGHALEFGVSTGETLRMIAAAMPVIGFDVFTGLPEDWRPGFPRGSFACSPPTVPNAELVVGLFEDTLPGYDFTRLDIGLVHIDCDLYASAATVLKYVGPHLQSGCFLVFDEFHNYPGAGPDSGEWRAWREYVADTGIHYSIIGYGPEQLALQIQ